MYATERVQAEQVGAPAIIGKWLAQVYVIYA